VCVFCIVCCLMWFSAQNLLNREGQDNICCGIYVVKSCVRMRSHQAVGCKLQLYAIEVEVAGYKWREQRSVFTYCMILNSCKQIELRVKRRSYIHTYIIKYMHVNINCMLHNFIYTVHVLTCICIKSAICFCLLGFQGCLLAYWCNHSAWALTVMFSNWS
jgi:hypothetical protein